MIQNKFNSPITLAITGASGAQYGFTLLKSLIAANHQVYLMISKAAQMVIALETEIKLPSNLAKMQSFLDEMSQAQPDQLHVLAKEDWTACVASGSGAPKQMVICPCSTGSLSAVSTGACNNLIERAADVVLKERNQLILVIRETPLSTIHLQNMLTLSQAGAVILPAMPGFYQKPETVQDMVDFVVARVLNQLNIKQDLLPGWGK